MRASTSTASTPTAPTGCRITAGPAGRPPRWRRSRCAPAPGRSARRQHRPGAESLPGPGRSVAAVVAIEARTSTRPVSTQPTPISCRIAAGPPRRCSWWRAPAPTRPARHRHRSAAGSPPVLPVGRRGGAAGGARHQQVDQCAAGADRLQDQPRPDRPAVAVVKIKRCAPAPARLARRRRPAVLAAGPALTAPDETKKKAQPLDAIGREAEYLAFAFHWECSQGTIRSKLPVIPTAEQTVGVRWTPMVSAVVGVVVIS